MLTLADGVADLGLIPKLVTLPGHAPGDTLKSFSGVSADVWLSTMTAAIQSMKPAGPKATLAFSMGGLCYLAALAQLWRQDPANYTEPQAHILLAPALAVRLWTQSANLLRWWPGLVLPSASPRSYRRHQGTPIAAYQGLADLMAMLLGAQKAGFRLHNPILMAMNPRDELVNPDATRQILLSLCQGQEGLLEVVWLNNHGSRIRPKFAHLVLDAACLGDSEYARLLQTIRSFLKTTLS
jgi:esterase/lipase